MHGDIEVRPLVVLELPAEDEIAITEGKEVVEHPRVIQKTI